MILFKNKLNYIVSKKILAKFSFLKKRLAALHTNPCTNLSENETLMRDSVRQFAQRELQPIVSKMDQQGFMDKLLIQSLFDQGLMGIEVPMKYGGINASFFSSILAIEEIAKVDPSVSLLVDIQNTLIVTLIRTLGTEAQSNYYLPRLATDMIGSFALSEPEAGSDAFALRTRARRVGDDFVLEGSKCWISNSAEAGVFIVFANVDPEKKHRGITAFLVPRDTPGFSVGKKEDKLGLRASSTCTLHLDGVRVPATGDWGEAGVLGIVGQGYRHAIVGLNEGRVGIAAQMLGLAQGCFDFSFQYVRERRQFGRPIWEFQAVQHQIASVASKLLALRTFVYNVARMKEAGQPIECQAAMVKWMAAEVAAETTSRCVEWLGGVGFTKNYPVEKFYRDVKIGSIYEGTNNIQLNTIAKYLEKSEESMTSGAN